MSEVMRFRFPQFARVLGILLMVGCVSQPVLAQRGKQGQKKVPPMAQNMNPNPGKAPNAGNPSAQPGKNAQGNEGRNLMGLPPKWVDRLQSMPPQEQERFMQNNERFKSLPPDRQEQIRRQLGNWNRMTPQQQEDFRRREQALEQMTPEQRRYFIQELGPRFKQLPMERRQAIRRRLNVLSGLSEAQREARLNDPNFLRGLSPDDQKMLRDLSKLRLGAVEPPPAPPIEPPSE
jgi:hypothetical protein